MVSDRSRKLLLLLAVVVPPAVSWLPIAPMIDSRYRRCRVGPRSRVVIPPRFPSYQHQIDDTSAALGAASIADGGRNQHGLQALSNSRRNRVLTALSMGADGGGMEEELTNVRSMRASEIKKTLTEMSIGTSGVFEKEVLVQMLVAERMRVGQAPPVVGTPVATKAGQREGRKQDSPADTRETSYGDGGWTPPPETWTEAKFAKGAGQARVTSDGTVVPMIRIRPSESVLGDGISVDQKDYYCIEIDLPDAPSGPTRELFMLDTAATSSLLTPRASKRLGAQKTGVSAMGAAGTDGVTGLYQVGLGEVKVADQSFGSLKPVVMELPITDITGKGSEGLEKGVSGILGMDFLSRFDVKLNFQTGDATFGNPGSAASGGLGSGDMTEVLGKVLPTGFFVIDVKMRPTDGGQTGRAQPIPAIVDLGSAFTISNWAAGKVAGLEPLGPNVKYNGQVVAGAAAPGEVYKPVEVGEANMDLSIGGQSIGGVTTKRSVLRSRPVMFADLPGFKAMRMFGPTVILGSDVLKLGKGAMIVSFYSRKIWLAL